MPIATYRPDLDFTVEELEKATKEDISETGPLRRRNERLWEGAISWAYCPDLRQKRLQEEHEKRLRPKPKPAPAPSPPAAAARSAPLPQKQLETWTVGIARAVKVWVCNEFAGASRVSALDFRILELEQRIAGYEKRLGAAEHRFSEQARHLRNLQSKIDSGKIERSPKGL
jgi:hypothetical protein